MALHNYICVQCGCQYPASAEPPAGCIICQDDRQYVNWNGQQWTTLEEMQQSGKYSNLIKPEGPGIYGIGTEPGVAIGQRALLVQAPGGNILWDCMTFIDQDTIDTVRQLGGISAIAVSHPHFYATIVEWSQAFGGVPIYLHAADRRWVTRPDPAIVFWEGETHSLGEGLTLIRGGIHFEGGAILHWAAGAEGKGALLTGDIFTVVSDRRYTGFMYSYPNLIPEEPNIIKEAIRKVEPFDFEQIYGAWWQRNVYKDAKAGLKFSAERYLRKVGTSLDE